MNWIFLAVIPVPGLAPEKYVALGEAIKTAMHCVDGEEYATCPTLISPLQELLAGELPKPESLRTARAWRETNPETNMSQFLERTRRFHQEHGDGASIHDTPCVQIHMGSEDINAAVQRVADILPPDTVRELKFFRAPPKKPR